MAPKKKVVPKVVVDLSTKMDDKCEEKSESSVKNSTKVSEIFDEKKTECENTAGLGSNEKISVVERVEIEETVERVKEEKKVQGKIAEPTPCETPTGRGVPLIYQERLDQLFQKFSQEEVVNYKTRMLKFGLTEEQLIAILQQQLQIKKKPLGNKESKWKKRPNQQHSKGKEQEESQHRKPKNDDRSRTRDQRPIKPRQKSKEIPFPKWRARQ